MTTPAWIEKHFKLFEEVGWEDVTYSGEVVRDLIAEVRRLREVVKHLDTEEECSECSALSEKDLNELLDEGKAIREERDRLREEIHNLRDVGTENLVAKLREELATAKEIISGKTFYDVRRAALEEAADEVEHVCRERWTDSHIPVLCFKIQHNLRRMAWSDR